MAACLLMGQQLSACCCGGDRYAKHDMSALLIEALHGEVVQQRTMSGLRSRIAYEWECLDKDQSGDLCLGEVKILISKLNLNIDAATVQAKYNSFDANRDGVLSRSEFTLFFEHLSSFPDVSETFADLSQGRGFMTVDDLQQFIEQWQGGLGGLTCPDGPMKAASKDIYAGIYEAVLQEAPRPLIGSAKSRKPSKASEDGVILEDVGVTHLGWDERAFITFLTWSNPDPGAEHTEHLDFAMDNFLRDRSKTETGAVYQAMGWPLSHYFISSSHNSYVRPER